ncbi:hypothetical protein [Fibrella aquatica]|uniref:hypothetical protein n=1 Tax=Fibrella aquatica TaxID=3242487 RepID=UPI0035220DE1
MKTDPFDDAIRRKLEGVDPPFQEKNWTQFQRFMGSQGFPPSLWQTPTRWLQPTMMAAAVAGVIISTIWQYRTTQALTEHVRTLTKTVERMEQAQTRLQQSMADQLSASVRIDTVYLTTTPSANALTTPKAIAGQLHSTDAVLDQPNQQQQQVAKGSVSSIQEPSGSAVATRSNRLVNQQRADDSVVDRLSEPSRLEADPVAAGNTARSANSLARDRSRYAGESAGAVPLPPESDRKNMGQTTQPGKSPDKNQFSDYQSSASKNRLTRVNEPTLYSPSVANQINTSETTVANPMLYSTGPLSMVQPLAPRSMPDPADAFTDSWQRHLRRVRYRSPYTTTMNATVATVKPTAPEQNTVPLPVKFRLGVGGDVGTVQSGLGFHAEAIISNRLTISTGLAQTEWKGDEFITEKQFTAKTKRDFKENYPGSKPQMPTGPGRPHEVLNINRTAKSIMVPVQFGYRFNVNNLFVLTPTVGLNLSVNTYETVNFEYDRLQPREDVRQQIRIQRPLAWYSTVQAGAGVERQWGHFVGQFSPVVLMPVQQSAASLNAASVGLRGRLFYQF